MPSIFLQVNSILSTKERRRFLYVVLGALVMAALEVVGIGTIVAFMGILTHPDLIFQNQLLNRLNTYLNVGDTHKFVLVCGFVLLMIYVIRNVFAAFMVWLQLKFVWGTLHSLSNRLLEKYIYRPYQYFLTRNSSDLQNNLLSEMNHVVNGIVMPATRLVTQSILTAGILGLLFWNDPVLASAITLSFGGTYALIYFGFRHRLLTIGVQRVAANKQRFKSLSEAFGGIKQVRITGREDYFTGNFSRALKSYTRQMIASSLITQIPKYLVEALTFGGILAIVLYIVGVKHSMQDIIPVGTLYAMAAYRLLPAFQQITNSLSAFRFNRKSLDVTVYDLAIDDSAPDAQQVKAILRQTIAYRNAIRLTDVSFRYPAAQQDAVHQLTLSIRRNTSVESTPKLVTAVRKTLRYLHQHAH